MIIVVCLRGCLGMRVEPVEKVRVRVSLVFIIPQTCMSVYYHDNSGLVEGLHWYEGRTG